MKKLSRRTDRLWLTFSMYCQVLQTTNYCAWGCDRFINCVVSTQKTKNRSAFGGKIGMRYASTAMVLRM